MEGRKTLHTAKNIFLYLFVLGSPFSIALTQSSLFFLFLTVILIMIVEKKMLFPSTVLDWYFIAYILLGMLSWIVNREQSMTVIFLKRLSLIPIVYLIPASIQSRKQLKTVLIILITVMSILSVIGIQKYLSGVGGLEGRLSLYHHYMTSGGIIMIVCLITAALAFSPIPRKVRIGAAAACLIMVLPLLFTFTRSSWLGFIAGVLVIGILQYRKLIAGVLALVLLFILFAPQSMKNRIIDTADPNHWSNRERLYMWKAGIEIMKDHPAAGVGDIDLGEYYRQYKSPLAREQHGHLHNNLIMFAATLGIPGLLFFLVFFIRVWIMEFRIYRALPPDDWLLRSVALGSLAVLAGFHVNGLFEWNFGDAEIAMLLWFSIGLSITVKRLHLTGP